MGGTQEPPDGEPRDGQERSTPPEWETTEFPAVNFDGYPPPEQPQYPSGRPEYGSGQPEYGSGQPEYGSGQPEYGSGQPEYGYGAAPYDPNAYDPNAYDPNAYGGSSYDPNAYAQGPAGYGAAPGGYGSPPQGPAQGPGQGQGWPAPPPPPSRSSRTLMIAVVVVIVLAGAGVGAYFAFSGSDSGSKSAGPTGTTPTATGGGNSGAGSSSASDSGGGTTGSKVTAPSSFDGYTELNNAAAQAAKTAISGVTSGSGGGSADLLKAATVTVYGPHGTQTPSIITFAVPTSQVPGSPSPDDFTKSFLAGVATKVETVNAGSHGGSARCAQATFGTTHETLCSWSDSSTSGGIVSVLPALPISELTSVENSFRDSVD